MKVKAVNGFARILKAEGIPWVSCYPTSPVNNALGEEGVPHPHDGRGALRGRGGRRLLAGDQRQADRRLHGHGRTSTRRASRWPSAPSRRRGRTPRRCWSIAEGVGPGRQPPHPLRHGRGLQVGHQVGGQGRPRRSHSRVRAPRLHPPALGPAGPGAAAHPARSRRVRRGRASLRAGEGLALRARSGRRQGGGPRAARGQGSPALRRRGRAATRTRRPSCCSSPSWPRCRC